MDSWRPRRRVGRSSAFSVGERRSPYPTKSHYRDLTRVNVCKGCTYDGKARTQGGWPGSRCATTFQAAVARAHSVSVIGWTCNVARLDGVEASRKGGLGQRPAVITWHSQKGRGESGAVFFVVHAKERVIDADASCAGCHQRGYGNAVHGRAPPYGSVVGGCRRCDAGAWRHALGQACVAAARESATYE